MPQVLQHSTWGGVLTVSSEIVSRLCYDSRLDSNKWTTVTTEQLTYPGNERSSSRRMKENLTQPKFHIESASESDF
jgi:hypothetical protein